MLALWGSGGIKAGEGMPPVRASASTKKVAVAAVPCVLAQKMSSALESGGHHPPRCSHSNFFLRLRRAAARVTLFLLKSRFPCKTNEKSTLLVRKLSGGFKSEVPTAVPWSPPTALQPQQLLFSQIAQGYSESETFFLEIAFSLQSQ